MIVGLIKFLANPFGEMEYDAIRKELDIYNKTDRQLLKLKSKLLMRHQMCCIIHGVSIGELKKKLSVVRQELQRREHKQKEQWKD